MGKLLRAAHRVQHPLLAVAVAATGLLFPDTCPYDYLVLARAVLLAAAFYTGFYLTGRHLCRIGHIQVRAIVGAVGLLLWLPAATSALAMVLTRSPLLCLPAFAGGACGLTRARCTSVEVVA